jgi:hypothetical protein
VSGRVKQHPRYTIFESDRRRSKFLMEASAFRVQEKGIGECAEPTDAGKRHYPVVDPGIACIERANARAREH